MNRRVIFLFTFLLTVYAGINIYIGWHVTEWFKLVGVSFSPWAFWVPFGLIAYGYILGRVPLPHAIKPAGRLLKIVGAYYIFIMETGLILFLLEDLIGLVPRIAGWNIDDYSIYAGSIVMGALALLFIVGSRNAWSPIVRTYELPIDKSAGENGQREWTVAVASDIHLGNIVGRRHLRRLLKRVNEMQPDLILLPGDVIDDSIEPFIRNRMGELLGQLKAKHGVLAVLGNHEYYGGHIDSYIEQMNAIGIQVLRDESVKVADAITVVGRKDKTAEGGPFGGREVIGDLLGGLDHNKPIIVLDHQPTKFAEAAEAGADVLLSGHTHRGQFAPNHLFTRRLFELDWGYMRKEAMHVVVSSGFGSWGPAIRIGSRSEIIRLEIKLLP
ncbi:metallophosphoesterase [Cohnella endophytica]|uniref:Metallophosphoesterase n=2 Tax=Cohnella endophytica TaxID=2419778 RepID=A0A494Y5M3_9BACL|nr:metallophosphoesterase [Cohnella endophytica]